jgi:hypothetical protein
VGLRVELEAAAELVLGLGLGRVALHAVLDEHGADLRLEELDRLWVVRGAGDGRGERGERDN